MPANMKIRSAYSSLPSAERKVADFILENPKRAPLMVINEIADAAGVSVPSVTRLAKKLGYSGFLDFRVALASGSADLEKGKFAPITVDDDDDTVIEKMFSASIRALDDTYKALNKEDFCKLAEMIVSGRRILVFGMESSALLAKDFVVQLNYYGYDAVAVTDPIVMNMYAKRFNGDEIVIGFSRSGRNKNIIDAMRAAKKAGVLCAFISNYVNSPAAQLSDLFFCTSRIDDVKLLLGRETNHTMLAFANSLLLLVAKKSGYPQ